MTFLWRLSAADDTAERGKYLVNDVAKCGDCHTPMDETGKPDAAKFLKGAMLVFQPIQPIPGWHKASPDLTPASRLWERWGEAGLVKFLETAQNPNGHAAGAPMPAYKMSHEDAQAVVAYLKTLK